MHKALCKYVISCLHHYCSLLFITVVHCSVAESCLTLCNPMNCSTPGFPVLHYLPEFAQTHVHWVSDAIQPSLSVAFFSSCLQSFPASGSIPVSQVFVSRGQIIGASASALVLAMNIQDWFPLGLTGFISLLSKGLSRVFSSTAVESINSWVLSLLYGSTLPSVHDYCKP